MYWIRQQDADPRLRQLVIDAVERDHISTILVPKISAVAEKVLPNLVLQMISIDSMMKPCYISSYLVKPFQKMPNVNRAPLGSSMTISHKNRWRSLLQSVVTLGLQPDMDWETQRAIRSSNLCIISTLAVAALLVCAFSVLGSMSQAFLGMPVVVLCLFCLAANARGHDRIARMSLTFGCAIMVVVCFAVLGPPINYFICITPGCAVFLFREEEEKALWVLFSICLVVVFGTNLQYFDTYPFPARASFQSVLAQYIVLPIFAMLTLFGMSSISYQIAELERAMDSERERKLSRFVSDFSENFRSATEQDLKDIDTYFQEYEQTRSEDAKIQMMSDIETIARRIQSIKATFDKRL